MRYVAAYLLAVLGGNETPSAADIEKVLSSVGIDADAERLKLVVGQLKGKNIEDLIKEGKSLINCMMYLRHILIHVIHSLSGREKLCSMPSGAAAAPAAAAPAAAAAAPAAKKGKSQRRSMDTSLLLLTTTTCFAFYHYRGEEGRRGGGGR